MNVAAMQKADPKGVLTGSHFMDGNHACCEGAIAAGCRFVSGYPITPSTEVVERYAARIPAVGGMFIQMEDEIASSITLQGAVWGGAKAMTVTSGPGYSLMMEHIGLAAISETPCVFVNVQRGGPSTGLPTLPGQGDMMQTKWGSHGDYEVIALAPTSPQECFDLVIEAFNLSEKFRTPVFFMMDECVGHMTEKVVIPDASKIEVFPRRFTEKKPGEFLLYAPEGPHGVPEMAKIGDGHRIHVTGLTHDERGYPVMSPDCQVTMMDRLIGKIVNNTDEIFRVEEEGMEDADVAIVSYGISHRVAMRGIQLARKEGVKVGQIRLVTVWPFPEDYIRKAAEKVKALITVELNLGQMVHEVKRAVEGACPVELCGHHGGGVHDPNEICRTILEAARK